MLIEVDRQPSGKVLRQFAGIWLVFFGIVGWGIHRRTGLWLPAVSVWAAAAVVGVAGLLIPRSVRLVYVGMSYATWPIGMAVSFVFVVAIYYLVLTPIGLIMRWSGYDRLTLAKRTAAGSYWQTRKRRSGTESYFHQS